MFSAILFVPSTQTTDNQILMRCRRELNFQQRGISHDRIYDNFIYLIRQINSFF